MRCATATRPCAVLIAALVPTMFVIAQPDLGSGLVYMTIAFMLLFIAGTSWRHLAALAALVCVSIAFVLVAAPAVGVHVLKPYQVERLTAFLHPDAAKSQKEGTEERSLPAGTVEDRNRLRPEDRPRGKHSQVSNGYVPESDTDFVFAAVGERTASSAPGSCCCCMRCCLSRALRVLVMAKDLFGSLIAAGVAAMLMFQVFVNVGMTIGIMPITGVTLPLMSYGGSSVITTMLAYRPAAIDLRPGARLASVEGPRTALLEMKCPPSIPHHHRRPRWRSGRASAALGSPDRVPPRACRARRQGAHPPARLGSSPYRKTGSN